MILERLRRAIREQNWFAVVLEICIVVLGVVIGFQVTAWGQARGDRAQEQVYLRQLAADFRETETALEDAIDDNERTKARFDSLNAAFMATAPPADSTLDRLARVLVQPAILTMGSPRALIETGDINLIRDDSLRAAVVGLIDAIEWFTGSQNFAMYEMGYPAFQRLSRRQRPTSGDGHRFHVQAETLLADAAFYDDVQSIRMTQRHILNTQDGMLTRIRAALTQVEAELKQ
jgi:hypothetical protein